MFRESIAKLLDALEMFAFAFVYYLSPIVCKCFEVKDHAFRPVCISRSASLVFCMLLGYRDDFMALKQRVLSEHKENNLIRKKCFLKDTAAGVFIEKESRTPGVLGWL